MFVSFPIRRCLVAGLFAAVPAIAAAPAAAHVATAGGAQAPERPEVAALACESGQAGACPRGEILRVKGEYLSGARTVVFLGRRGRRDDRRARAASASPHRVVVRVPQSARSGAVKVVGAVAGPSTPGPRLRIVPAEAPAAPNAATPGTGGVFPVAGKYDFGTEVNRFGGGRGHKGQDVFAKCGTPIVAAMSGRVTIAKWDDRAGNYAVIKAADGTGQAYMHLLEPAAVEKNQVVQAGQQIGLTGETGRASGCHLHFEFWTAPGWYTGGEPIDPLPALQRWAAGP